MDLAAEGSAVDLAADNLAVDIDNRLIAHACHGLINAIDIVKSVINPDTNRDTDQSLIGSLCLGSILKLHGNSQQLGNLVVLEGSSEAIGNHCALGLPGIGVIQLQDSGHGFNSGQISHIDVHKVDRLSLGSLAGIIVTSQNNSSLTADGEGAGQAIGVAQLILDLEGHGVGTGTQGHILLGGQGVAGNDRLDLDAIDHDLTGGQIHSGIISDGCGEGEVGTADSCTVIQGNSSIRGSVGGSSDLRQHTIIHSGAVVQSNVVDVEGHNIRSIGLDIGTDEGGRTGIACIGGHGSAEIIVLGNVDGCIDPTGLRDVCIGSRVQVGLLASRSRGEHEMILLAGVRPVSILHIELRLERQTLTGRGECILGNVQPHTQRGGLHAVGNIAQNNGIAGVEQDIIGPLGKISITVVQSPGQCILTVANMTTFIRSYGKDLTAGLSIHLTGQRVGSNKGVFDTVVDGPLLGILEAHEASLVTVLEIIDDLGALAELDGIDQADGAVGDGHIDTQNRGIGGSSELEAVQLAGSLIGQRNRNRIGVHKDIALAGHGDDGQGDGTDLLLGRVGHNSGGGGQLKYLGVIHGDGLGADYCAAGENLNFHHTLGAVRNKGTVLDGAKGIIGQVPLGIGGHLHGVAVGVDGLSEEGIYGVGSEDIIFSSHIHHIQDTGRGHIRGNENAMRGGTLSTVTGDRAHGEGLLADTLGQEGRGAAAVTVSSPLTAQSQHGLAQLIGAETNRVVGTTTVVHTDDQGTVLLDTDHGTGSSRGSALLSLVHQLTVLNGHAKGNGNSVQQDALLQVTVEVILAVGLDIAGDVALGIPEDIQDRGGGGILTLDTDVLAVVDQDTGSIGIVVQVGIHAANDVVAKDILIISRHFGQLLMGPIGLIIGILCDLIDLIVTRDDRHIRIGGVHLDDVEDLSAVARIVVQNDFGLNCSTGNEYVILLRDHVVVAIGAEGGAVIHNIRVFPVRNGRKSDRRHEAEQHHQGQNHGHYADCQFACHFLFSFSEYLYKHRTVSISCQMLPERNIGENIQGIVVIHCINQKIVHKIGCHNSDRQSGNLRKLRPAAFGDFRDQNGNKQQEVIIHSHGQRVKHGKNLQHNRQQQDIAHGNGILIQFFFIRYYIGINGKQNQKQQNRGCSGSRCCLVLFPKQCDQIVKNCRTEDINRQHTGNHKP